MSKIFLVGNPNTGKTTLFNQLTGLNQKTGNYPGVTVEKKTGEFKIHDKVYQIVDLPGIHSLGNSTEEKWIASKELLEWKKGDQCVYVLDSIQIERGLHLFLQISEIGIPILVVLTMGDVLSKKNLSLDIESLSNSLSTKVISLNPKTGNRIQELKDAISVNDSFQIPNLDFRQNSSQELGIRSIHKKIDSNQNKTTLFLVREAWESWGRSKEPIFAGKYFSEEVFDSLKKAFNQSSIRITEEDDALHRSIWIKKIVTKVVIGSKEHLKMNPWDQILLHPFYGMVIFLGLVFIMFESLFFGAEYPMKAIETLIEILQSYVKAILPDGNLQNLIDVGVIGGVGNVIVFLPQILLLFFFIGILEESGYMARVSFLMDRFMGRFGLSGKSFVPLFSSAACAVPAILSTRSIESKSERIATILVSPLIMCSARYPVYFLIIGVVFPGKEGIMMFFLFIAGLIASLLMALLFKKTLFKGHSHYFIMELPEYKTPSLRSLGITSWSKAKSFLFTSGKTILLFSILLWFLSTHPRGSEPKESYIGQVGSYMENFTQTQGWDWKMGVGILSSFMAREVMVSTMAVLYGVEEDNEDGLKGKMRSDLDKNGAPLWNSVTGLSLLLFFAFASQCASTLAVVRKETNSYFWPLFQFLYMTILAIFSSWLVAVLVRNLN